MNYTLEPIAERLKQAREGKGLSQRALSKLAGVPQSHISRIENGGVDLRVSSLIELARVLDLELMLVPRKSVSAVRAVTGGQHLHGSFENTKRARSAYSLEEDDDG